VITRALQLKVVVPAEVVLSQLSDHLPFRFRPDFCHEMRNLVKLGQQPLFSFLGTGWTTMKLVGHRRGIGSCEASRNSQKEILQRRGFCMVFGPAHLEIERTVRNGPAGKGFCVPAISGPTLRRNGMALSNSACARGMGKRGCPCPKANTRITERGIKTTLEAKDTNSLLGTRYSGVSSGFSEHSCCCFLTSTLTPSCAIDPPSRLPLRWTFPLL
jgi:hypothetical protein